MTLINELESYITKTINELGYEIDNVKLEKSKMIELGEYQINVAMSLAKKYGKNPVVIANEIVEALDDKFVNVNIAGPGFINVTLNDQLLLDYVNGGIEDFTKLYDKKESKKIVLDYGGANIAKELHVGHLRCNIGEAIRRLANLLGDVTISDVHWGDWGTPIGLVMRQIQEEMPDLVYFDENYDGEYPNVSPVTNEDLGRMYPMASARKKDDEQFALEARIMTEGFQKGKKGLRELWQHIVNVSRDDCNKVYEYLNCHFDYSYGESDADKYVDATLDVLKSSGMTEVSNGALIMNVKEETDNKEIPPLLLIKSDGGVLYDTTELATIYQRSKDFNPDGIWYFTDERQSLHFEQNFRGALKSGLVRPDTDFKFVGFGTINGPDGKPFKTRDGGVMSLKGLIKLVYDNIEPKIKEEITGEERIDVANKLTVATLKYSDLLPFRKTDYIFDVEKFTSFEGKTGIYVVYTLTRIKSLLSKLNTESCTIKEVYNKEIRDILVKTTDLPKVLNNSYADVTLSYICEYIYELCSLFNKFYTNYNISAEIDDNKKESYIAVSKLTYNILSNLLDVLGIEQVSRM